MQKAGYADQGKHSTELYTVVLDANECISATISADKTLNLRHGQQSM